MLHIFCCNHRTVALTIHIHDPLMPRTIIPLQTVIFRDALRVLAVLLVHFTLNMTIFIFILEYTISISATVNNIIHAIEGEAI